MLLLTARDGVEVAFEGGHVVGLHGERIGDQGIGEGVETIVEPLDLGALGEADDPGAGPSEAGHEVVPRGRDPGDDVARPGERVGHEREELVGGAPVGCLARLQQVTVAQRDVVARHLDRGVGEQGGELPLAPGRETGARRVPEARSRRRGRW